MTELSKGEGLVYDFKAACIGACGDAVELDDIRYQEKTELALLKYVTGLESCIAELEAEIAELKPYRDGYDPEKAFPPEGEWVWLRDCDDHIEPVQYDYKAGFYWNYGTNPDGEPFWYWEPDNGDLVRWYPIGKLPEEREK